MPSFSQVAIVAVVIAVLSFGISYGGIFGFIPLSTQLQLLLQVIGVAIVVLGLAFTGMFKLNKSIDQADQADRK